MEVLLHSLFEGVFECLPHKLKDIFSMLPFKLHSMLYVHIRRNIYLFIRVVELQLHSQFVMSFNPITFLVLLTGWFFRIAPRLGNGWESIIVCSHFRMWDFWNLLMMLWILSRHDFENTIQKNSFVYLPSYYFLCLLPPLMYILPKLFQIGESFQIYPWFC